MRIILGLILFIALNSWASAQTTVAPTPALPQPDKSGYAAIDGAKIWYAMYGEGQPVILLHGGLTNSNYWGKQIPVLAKHYQVIVMDTRGVGRSSRDTQLFSYELMSQDVLGLMDYLKINKAIIVGWSDGAIVGLDLAIHHPERVSKLFAYGANTDPRGNRANPHGAYVTAIEARTPQEYQALSPTPHDFPLVRQAIFKMWKTEPHIGSKELHSITVPTWIVDGDYDEIIKDEHVRYIAAQIPNARLVILPHTGHFAPIDKPQEFNDALLEFLKK